MSAVWAIPLIPLAGFVLLVSLGRRMGDPVAGWVGTLAAGASFVITVAVWLDMLSVTAEERVRSVTLFRWIQAGGFEADLSLRVDPLAVTWALIVCGVGAVIHLYSIGYMKGDDGFSRYFAYLNLFLASMLLLVFGGNMLVTFLGWEGVGLCSYLLISFWFDEETNAVAGKKAFVTNRIGDVGFLVAMMFAFRATGTLDVGRVIEGAEAMVSATATAIGVGLLVAATGKSAQIPLFVWLPDAMAGPTPVSALIHAATMVTAGVYVLVRFAPILEAADPLLPGLVAAVGAATALTAAFAAAAQTDIKKVLAYSTVSQLGFMFAAVGVGAYVAAVFHVVTHAFFKALLFLGSGSVIHGLGGEQDMRRMGGLTSSMPLTAGTFMVGWLAIAGVPPLSGFWSKDEIVVSVFSEQPVLGGVLLLSALLTAWYMTRLVVAVFWGKPRLGDGVHAHEAPASMGVPLVLLAVAAVLGGILELPFGESLQFLSGFLDPVLGHGHHAAASSGTKIALAAASIVVAAIGLAGAAVTYRRNTVAAIEREPQLARRALLIDDFYSWLVDNPGRSLFDGLANFDKKVVDGIVRGTGGVVVRLGRRVGALSDGFVRRYAMLLGAGAALFVVLGVARSLS
ncbi:MAG: NADH-quinone oxidoreductase, L subunit NuoL [Acidimicrobiales bacterium]|nr:MAG: NADH-quinone oxidoreductase, L subunit NuoL [Acidimicrobiales bacterium]